MKTAMIGIGTGTEIENAIEIEIENVTDTEALGDREGLLILTTVNILH